MPYRKKSCCRENVPRHRCYVGIRRPVGSTDQANPSCFYFRISRIWMERR
jgi:hypothetical protein